MNSEDNNTMPIPGPTPQPQRPQQSQSRPQPSGLNVPVMSPTHFDQPRQPQPIVPTPQQAQQYSPEKTVKKFGTLATIASVFAVIFLILGIWGLIFGLTKNDELAKAEADLANKNAIVAALEAATGQTVATPADVPVYQTTHGYVYVDGWNVKFKVPDQLGNVSYILNQKNYHPSICFNALKTGVNTFPAFADVAQNPGRMGCIMRAPVSDGDAASDGTSYGQRVFTDQDFNYFYTGAPAVYSTDAAEQALEQESVQLLKVMLTENISRYE